MRRSDAEAIAKRLSLPPDAVRRLQRRGILRQLALEDREIRERLWEAHLEYVLRRRRDEKPR